MPLLPLLRTPKRLGVSRRPPRWPFSVNRDSSLSHGLISAGVIDLDGVVRDVGWSTGAFGAIQQSPSFEGSAVGRVLQLNDDGQNGETIVMNHLAGVLDGLTGMTYAVYARLLGPSTERHALGLQYRNSQGTTDANADRVRFFYDASTVELDLTLRGGNGTSPQLQGSYDLDDGGFHWMVARFWQGPTQHRMGVWADGQELDDKGISPTDLSSLATDLVPEVMGGERVTQNGSWSPSFELKAWTLHGRGLGPTEIEALETWDLFVESRRLFYFFSSVVTTETERLALTALLAGGTNLEDTLSNSPPTRLADIDEDTDTDDTEWWTAIDVTLATDIRVGFPTPSNTLTGTQTFNARLRKTAGTPDPTIDMILQGSGVTGSPVTLLSGVAITATDPGQVVTGTIDASEITDPANVELRIVSTPGTG